MNMFGNMGLAVRRAKCLSEELPLLYILGAALLYARDVSNTVSGSHGAMYSLFHKEQANLGSIPSRPRKEIARLVFYDAGMNEATGLMWCALFGLRFSGAISGNIILARGRQICFVDVPLLNSWMSKVDMMPEETMYIESLAEHYRALTAA